MKEIIIATKNQDKKKELKKLLTGLKIKVSCLDTYPNCPDVEEGENCFRENAILKAMSASKFTGKLSIADDSGLEVDALGGEPGICSARFAGKNATYAKNNQKLLRDLDCKKPAQRAAQFRCVAAVCDYPKVIGVVEGRIRGRIALAPRGKNGFGYDPLFVVPKYKKTFAQLPRAVKNKISHRARALKKAKHLIRSYFKLNP